MTGDLYDTDIVTWSQRQTDLLRRVAAGERVNDQVDWANVIEEVESVGRSERDAVMSLLTNVLDHKLRLLCWTDHAAARHREAEVRAWIARVVRWYRPSMHLDAEMEDMFQIARLDTAAHMLDAGPPSTPLPTTCPWTLTELLADR